MSAVIIDWWHFTFYISQKKKILKICHGYGSLHCELALVQEGYMLQVKCINGGGYTSWSINSIVRFYGAERGTFITRLCTKKVYAFNKLEGIPVGCQPPPCRQYRLHNKQIWTCLGDSCTMRPNISTGGRPGSCKELGGWGPCRGWSQGPVQGWDPLGWAGPCMVGTL